jgi:hypothetical protein
MATIVYTTLDDYDLKEKLNCITTDNATNNYAMTKSLSQKLLAADKIKWDYKTNHIPCLAHIINLVVPKFLNCINTDNVDICDYYLDTNSDDIDIIPTEHGDMDPKAIHTLTTKIQKLAVSLRSSNICWEAFSTACESYGLKPMTIPLAITVRWNSTLNQLLAAVYLRRPIRRFVDDMYGQNEAERAKFHLSEEEWELAEVLVLFLLPFKRCSDRFECNSTYTEIDYVFFAYDTLFNHLDDVKDRLKSYVHLGTLACAPFM